VRWLRQGHVDCGGQPQRKQGADGSSPPAAPEPPLPAPPPQHTNNKEHAPLVQRPHEVGVQVLSVIDPPVVLDEPLTAHLVLHLGVVGVGVEHDDRVGQHVRHIRALEAVGVGGGGGGGGRGNPLRRKGGESSAVQVLGMSRLPTATSAPARVADDEPRCKLLHQPVDLLSFTGKTEALCSGGGWGDRVCRECEQCMGACTSAPTTLPTPTPSPSTQPTCKKALIAVSNSSLTKSMLSTYACMTFWVGWWGGGTRVRCWCGGGSWLVQALKLKAAPPLTHGTPQRRRQRAP